MNIEIDDTLKLEKFLLLCLHTDNNPVRNTKSGKSSKNSWNHLHCCLPDKLESMVLEFLSMERAKYVPIWNCLFCFKVALRLWFCRSIDHIFVLNQSRVLLVCLTLFLCEAKWHLLLDLLFVFCTKKKLAKENRRLESKCFFTQVTSSTEIVQLSAQSSSWCPCQKTARKMTKRPKKATAASMVTTIYYSDGFWQRSFFGF